MSGYVNAFDCFDSNPRDRARLSASSGAAAGTLVEPASVERNIFMAASRNQLGRLSAILNNSTAPIEITAMVNGMNSLHIAAKKGFVEVVQSLLTYSKENLDHVLSSSTSDDEKTALMIAAFNGQQGVVEVLVAKILGLENADLLLGQTDKRGNTALHYAAWGGHLPCVELLVTTGRISTSQGNSEDILPLQLAAAGNYTDVVSYLMKHQSHNDNNEPSSSTVIDASSSGMNALHRAASYGAVETVELLLQQPESFPVNALAGNGNTALHYAAQHGHFGVVLVLGENAQTAWSLKNDYGLTPLHYASLSGRLNIVQYLLEKHSGSVHGLGNSASESIATIGDIDVYSVNNDGENALHLAAAAGFHDVCTYLVEKAKMDVFVADRKGLTAIDKAIEAGFKELANKLAILASVAFKCREIEERFLQHQKLLQSM